MKPLDKPSQEHIQDFFSSIPKLKPIKVKRRKIAKNLKSFDATIAFRHRDVKYLVIVYNLIRSSPRAVKAKAYELRVRRGLIKEHVGKRMVVVPMLFGSYFSPQCRELCSEHKIAYLDLCGNAQFISETLMVTKEVERKPVPEVRKLRSIFGPKAGAILRSMLLEPNKVWKVKELADSSASSIGHVSNIRRALIEHDWVEERSTGVFLSKPDLLLQIWRENYRKPRGELLLGHTYLRDKDQTRIIRGLFNGFANDASPPLVYGCNSAAQYYAPFLRGTIRFFYANELGVQLLEKELELSYVDRGQNVVIQVVNDGSILKDRVEFERQTLCADPITTYLDLWNGNDREREAAEFLARKCFPWLE